MKYSARVSFAWVLLGLVCFCACAPQQKVVPAAGKPYLDPSIIYGTLPNGFQYLLKHNSQPKDRVYLHLNIFAGSMHETRSEQGVAHYLEHMLFNGSEHFQPGELVDYFHSIGMDFGADANASTGFFNTVYDLALPQSDKAHLDKAFLVFQDYARGALLLPSEIDRERGVILAEKRERDSVSFRTFKQTLAFELPGSLFNRRFPIGDEEVIRQADRKLLKGFYDKWYRPDNMVLIAVGDFDVQMAEQMICQRFSSLKPRTILADRHASARWADHSGTKAFYLFEAEASKTDVSIQTIEYAGFAEQTIEALKKEILHSIAFTMLQNRLSLQVNRQQASFIQASAFSGSYLHHVKTSGISVSCHPEKWRQSLEQVEQNLRQAIEYGYTQGELDRVKSEFIVSLEQAVSLADSQKSKQVARRLLHKINSKRLLISEIQRLNLLKPYIRNLTLDQVHKAFKACWQPDHRLVMVTGNARIENPGAESEILKTVQASSKEKVAAYRDIETKPFPYLDQSEKKGVIRERIATARDLGIDTIVFQNNVRLNIKKTQFKPNTFQIKVCFGPGKASEPLDKPGLAKLAASVLSQSGLGQMDMDQLDQALAGKKVHSNMGIRDSFFFFSGSGHPDDAATLFQLVNHFFRDPGFSEKALSLAKIRYRQQYEKSERTLDGKMKIDGDRFLAGNDPRFGIPAPETLDQYTLEDVKNWILPHISQAPIEISIVGDIDTDVMTQLTARYLGSLSRREPFEKQPGKMGPVRFPHGEKRVLTVDTKIESAIARVAFLTDDFWDIAQTRQLSLLAQVLSERVRKKIREELGESYSPYVYNHASSIFKGYGVLHMVVKIQPGSQDLVFEKLEAIVDSVLSSGITEKETRFALNPVLTHLKTLRESNRYWLNSVMVNSSVYPEKFDWARSLLSGYQQIDRKDLMRLAKKYLVWKKHAGIVIVPKDQSE